MCPSSCNIQHTSKGNREPVKGWQPRRVKETPNMNLSHRGEPNSPPTLSCCGQHPAMICSQSQACFLCTTGARPPRPLLIFHICRYKDISFTHRVGKGQDLGLLSKPFPLAWSQCLHPPELPTHIITDTVFLQGKRFKSLISTKSWLERDYQECWFISPATELFAYSH